MQEYVRKAIELAKKQDGIVHNKRLKRLVEQSTGKKIGNRWRYFSNAIKDESIAGGHAYVPYGRHWYYDPPFTILIEWVLATIKRHKAEVIRAADAVSLPRYRRTELATERSDEVLKQLEELKTAIDKAIQNIRKAQPGIDEP